MTPHSEPREKNLILPESMKRLCVQIRTMPELTDQAKVIDQFLLKRMQDLKATASTIVKEFNEQKKIILQRFDNWIMPIAQEVLDGLLKDAEQLKEKLDDKLEHLDQVTSEEWNEQAKDWAQLYSKMTDRRVLIDKILEAVADRTRHLIDKDIQVIQDYQSQSLAHLPEESETFKNVEERLANAISEPLKQLMTLRNQPKVHQSLQQASEWVAKLQQQREVYFDQLLMKIDHVMKDVVRLEDKNDMTSFVEIEGEIIFMERELHHINSDMASVNVQDESEKQFLLARLEGLLDHVNEFGEQTQSLPKIFHQRLQNLKANISLSLSNLQ